MRGYAVIGIILDFVNARFVKRGNVEISVDISEILVPTRKYVTGTRRLRRGRNGTFAERYFLRIQKRTVVIVESDFVIGDYRIIDFYGDVVLDVLQYRVVNSPYASVTVSCGYRGFFRVSADTYFGNIINFINYGHTAFGQNVCSESYGRLGIGFRVYYYVLRNKITYVYEFGPLGVKSDGGSYSVSREIPRFDAFRLSVPTVELVTLSFGSDSGSCDGVTVSDTARNGINNVFTVIVKIERNGIRIYNVYRGNGQIADDMVERNVPAYKMLVALGVVLGNGGFLDLAYSVLLRYAQVFTVRNVCKRTDFDLRLAVRIEIYESYGIRHGRVDRVHHDVCMYIGKDFTVPFAVLAVASGKRRNVGKRRALFYVTNDIFDSVDFVYESYRIELGPFGVKHGVFHHFVRIEVPSVVVCFFFIPTVESITVAFRFVGNGYERICAKIYVFDFGAFARFESYFAFLRVVVGIDYCDVVRRGRALVDQDDGKSLLRRRSIEPGDFEFRPDVGCVYGTRSAVRKPYHELNAVDVEFFADRITSFVLGVFAYLESSHGSGSACGQNQRS